MEGGGVKALNGEHLGGDGRRKGGERSLRVNASQLESPASKK